MDTAINEMIDAKFKLIDDLNTEHYNTPPGPDYNEYITKDMDHKMKIQAITQELRDILGNYPLYKRLFQMKKIGLL